MDAAYPPAVFCEKAAPGQVHHVRKVAAYISDVCYYCLRPIRVLEFGTGDTYRKRWAAVAVIQEWP